MEISLFDKVATPSLFADFSSLQIDFGDEKVRFYSNDLDVYLYSRGRLTDAQLAALTSQLSSSSSVFDGMTDEQRVQFLSSRYSQNFASVDNFRRYLVSNLEELETEMKSITSSDDPSDPAPVPSVESPE